VIINKIQCVFGDDEKDCDKEIEDSWIDRKSKGDKCKVAKTYTV
jgi:hypothetical protein